MLVRAYRKAREAETLDAANLRHAKRALTGNSDDDGSVVFQCRFEPEDGTRVVNALNCAFKAPNDDLPEDVLRKRLNGETGLIRQNKKPGLDIDASTGASCWGGETMGYDIALDGLFGADGVLEISPAEIVEMGSEPK